LFYILHANGPWSHPLGFATCSLLKIPIAPMHPYLVMDGPTSCHSIFLAKILLFF
jgi:hypothetical protein